MQIQNNPYTNTHNYSPNFKAIKAVKCKGLYEKFPEYGKILVDSFQKNQKAMEFCKKYDSEIIFYSSKDSLNKVTCAMKLLFKNPSKSKFLGLFGKSQDSISLFGFHNSLKESTESLRCCIANNNDGHSYGVLDQHIKIKEQEIANFLEKKAKGVASKAQKEAAAKAVKNQQIDNAQNLNTAIKNLIDSSK